MPEARVKKQILSVRSWPNSEAQVALFSVSFGENRPSNPRNQRREPTHNGPPSIRSKVTRFDFFVAFFGGSRLVAAIAKQDPLQRDTRLSKQLQLIMNEPSS